MQGFVGLRIPLWLHRLVTMAPRYAIVALEIDPTQALVLSQVVRIETDRRLRDLPSALSNGSVPWTTA
jgi:hypothetical protein